LFVAHHERSEFVHADIGGHHGAILAASDGGSSQDVDKHADTEGAGNGPGLRNGFPMGIQVPGPLLDTDQSSGDGDS
jgi:hypothetical protein